MKKTFNGYPVILFFLALSIGVLIYDFFFTWPVQLKWIEGFPWYLISLLFLLTGIKLIFPKVEGEKRSLLLSSLFTLICIFATCFGYLYQSTGNQSDSVSTIRAKQHNTPMNSSQTTPKVEKPTVDDPPRFTEKEADLFSPDMVILTKNLSALPADIINHSFLGKILTKETMFYYEDDPHYLGMLGMLRRISFEHELGIQDNILKYLLSIPAEVALWKGSNGKIKDFLFMANQTGLNQKIIGYYLKLKQIKSEKKLRKFSYNGHDGFYLSFRRHQIAVWNHQDKLYISNLPPKYFPDKNEKKLKEVIAKTVEKDNGKGFYQRLYNAELTSEHSILLNSKFLSFGYNYFSPALKAIRLDFEKKIWSMSSLIGSEQNMSELTSVDLWKALPSSVAMCAGVPINSERVSNIINKYKELTLNRLVGKENTLGDDLLSDQDVSNLINDVVAVCWYEKSSANTPLFITKVKKIEGKKDKIKYLFDKFIGGLEKNYEYAEIKESSVDGINTLSRLISSQYGIKSTPEEDKAKLKYKKVFEAKLAYNNEFMIFSPDADLVDLAISTMAKKNPSIHDELTISNKNISYYLNPLRMGQLLEKYIKQALPDQQESLFRKAIEGHLSEAFKNMASLKSIAIDMPTFNQKQKMSWQKLKFHDL